MLEIALNGGKRKKNRMWALPLVAQSVVIDKIYKQLKLDIEKGLNNSSLEKLQKFKGNIQFEPYFVGTCLTCLCPLKFSCCCCCLIDVGVLLFDVRFQPC